MINCAPNIKIMKPLRRINIKTAIELVWAGIEFICSNLPLDLIDDLKKYKLDELDAIDKVYDRFNTSFLPDKDASKAYIMKAQVDDDGNDSDVQGLAGKSYTFTSTGKIYTA